MQTSRLPIFIVTIITDIILVSALLNLNKSSILTLGAFFGHWFLTGFIFAEPFANAYMAGLNSARDMENRLTLVGPWFHFRRKFWPELARFYRICLAYILALLLMYKFSRFHSEETFYLWVIVFQAFSAQNLLALILAPR